MSLLTCRQCRTEFPRPRRTGRPPAYCGDDCRREANTEGRAILRRDAAQSPGGPDFSEPAPVIDDRPTGSLLTHDETDAGWRHGAVPETWTDRTSGSPEAAIREAHRLAEASANAAHHLREIESWLSDPDNAAALSDLPRAPAVGRTASPSSQPKPVDARASTSNSAVPDLGFQAIWPPLCALRPKAEGHRRFFAEGVAVVVLNPPRYR